MVKDKLNVKDRDIVVPGEVLASGMGFLPSKGTYRKDDDIIAERVGLISVDGKVLKLTPLSGTYHPKVNDIIIGTISDILMSGWRVNMDGAYEAIVPLAEASSEYISRGADLSRYFAIGDTVMAKITQVSSQMLIDVSMKGPGLRKLKGGRIIYVDSQKVPRIIGKKASMVQMIKDSTGVRIAVGQNGTIWLNGHPESEIVAVKAIRDIETNAHQKGLTDKIKIFLDKACKKLPKPEPREEEEERPRPRYDRDDRRDNRRNFRSGPRRDFKRDDRPRRDYNDRPRRDYNRDDRPRRDFKRDDERRDRDDKDDRRKPIRRGK